MDPDPNQKPRSEQIRHSVVVRARKKEWGTQKHGGLLAREQIAPKIMQNMPLKVSLGEEGEKTLKNTQKENNQKKLKILIF